MLTSTRFLWVLGLFVVFIIGLKSFTGWQGQQIIVESSRELRGEPVPWDCPVPGLVTAQQFADHVDTLETKCDNYKPFGGYPKGKRDAKKILCLDERFRINPDNCLVFSFGINNDFSFEDDIAEFGCEVFAYDPTMDVEDHQRSPRVQFIATGISNYNGTKVVGMGNNWKPRKVDRFENLVRAAGKEGQIIDIVKLDVEMSEVDWLQDMLFNSRHVLRNIKQIAMEIHARMQTSDVTQTSRYQVFWPYLQMLRCMGFRLVSTRGIVWRELVWVQEKEW